MSERRTVFRAPLGGLLGLAAVVLLLPAVWAEQGPTKGPAEDKKAEKKADDKKAPPKSAEDKGKAAELEKARADVKQAEEELRKLHEQAKAPLEKLFKARQRIAELEGRHAHGHWGHWGWHGREGWRFGGWRGREMWSWRNHWRGARFGFRGWGPPGPRHERPPVPPPPPPRAGERNPEIDRKLDAITKQLEEIKRELKK